MSGFDQPHAAGLLSAVAAFLRDQCAPALSGREAFLARVAANAVEIAAREARDGAAALAVERAALAHVLGERSDPAEDIAALRARASAAFADGRVTADNADVLDALEQAAAARVRIEQPRYASLKRAKANSPVARNVASAPQGAHERRDDTA